MPLVSVRQLSKSYGKNTVIDGLDLDIEKSSVVAVMGRSGSGKSTLLRCIGGLEIFQSGQLTCGDQELKAHQAADKGYFRNIGVVFQHFNLFPHLTALSNVTIALRKVQGLSKNVVMERGRAALETVGLWEKADAYPARLSGGQQQRVAIARALALEPKILLLDEVTSALDPELVEEVIGVLRSLAERGHTMLLVTHDIRFAETVADHIVFMHKGKIHEQGAAREIIRQPKTDELAQFLGLKQN
jgi:polar amino acid transport system ATP-binding protein